MNEAARQLPEAPRILCIRLSALGDTLLTFAAIAALRAAHPRAHITFLTDVRYADLLAGSESLDEVLLLDRVALGALRPGGIRSLVRALRPLIGGRWDAVVDFQSYTETAVLGLLTGARTRVGRRYKTRARWLYRPWIDSPHPDRYMAFAHLDTLARAGLVGKQLGGNSELRPYFHVPGSARISWAPRLAALGVPATARRVGLFVGAAEPDRRWAGQRFGDLANRLQELSPVPLSFLVLAGPNEQDAADRVLAATAGTPVAKRVVRAPTPDLLQLAAALQDCDVAICNDTGPLHLSVAVGTPSCGIYRRPLPHFLVPAPHRCVVASERQIDAIRVEEVLAAAGPLLEDAARVPERRSSLR